MAINKNTQANIDSSNLPDYPFSQIRDNSGADDGTPVARQTFSDIFEVFGKLMRLGNITYNNEYDNETNGYQYIAALKALAGKNDLVYVIDTDGDVTLNIDTDIGIMQQGEMLFGFAETNYNDEENIKGTADAPVLSIAVTDADKYNANDFLLLIRKPGGINIVRLATADNINALVAEYGYLKAANDATEIAGVATNVATTPASNLNAFIERIIGADSGDYLVASDHDGLMSAEDKVKLDAYVNPVKNIGWFSGVNPGFGTVGDSLPRDKNVVTAQITAVSPSGSGGSTDYLVTLTNAMPGDYFVRIMVESQGALNIDNNLFHPVFKPLTNLTFKISIQQAIAAGTQSLKLHLEVVDIS